MDRLPKIQIHRTAKRIEIYINNYLVDSLNIDDLSLSEDCMEEAEIRLNVNRDKNGNPKNIFQVLLGGWLVSSKNIPQLYLDLYTLTAWYELNKTTVKVEVIK